VPIHEEAYHVAEEPLGVRKLTGNKSWRHM